MVNVTTADVLEALQHVTPRRRQIFMLHTGLDDGIEYSYAEIADLLGISTRGVRSQFWQTKEAVRRYLEDDLAGPGKSMAKNPPLVVSEE